MNAAETSIPYAGVEEMSRKIIFELLGREDLYKEMFPKDNRIIYAAIGAVLSVATLTVFNLERIQNFFIKYQIAMALLALVRIFSHVCVCVYRSSRRVCILLSTCM